MDYDRLVGYGLTLAAVLQLLTLVGAVSSPTPLTTADSVVSVVLAVSLAVVGVSFVRDEGASIDGPWSRRSMVALTAIVITTSGLLAFFALA
jgi:hypothetical protein